MKFQPQKKKKSKKKWKVQANLLFRREDKTTAVPLAQYLPVKPCVCLNKRGGELQTSPWAEGTVSAAKHQASFKARALGLLLIPPLQLALPSLQARRRKSLKVDYDNKKPTNPPQQQARPKPTYKAEPLPINDLWFYIHRASCGEGKPETCSRKRHFTCL